MNRKARMAAAIGACSLMVGAVAFMTTHPIVGWANAVFCVWNAISAVQYARGAE